MNKVLKFFGVFLLTLILCLVTSCKKDKDDDDNAPVITYNVSYNTDGGQFPDGLGNKIMTYDENTKVDIIADVPVKDGFAFLGWFDSVSGEQILSSFYISKDVNLIAKWGTPTFKVVYDAGSGTFSDGTSEKIVNVEQNSAFAYIDIPTNSNGRLFNWWYNSETDELVEEKVIVGGYDEQGKPDPYLLEYKFKVDYNYKINGQAIKKNTQCVKMSRMI